MDDMYSTSTRSSKQNFKPPARLASVHILISEQEMRTFIKIYESTQRSGNKITPAESKTYNQYWRILANPFTASELLDMHYTCCRFRDNLHAGLTPNKEDQDYFIAFSKVIYEKGVPGGF
jgi:hypothetical protein